MIFFVSGKMTGLSDLGRKAFKEAEIYLSFMGHTVLSPANHIPMLHPESITHEQYIHICKAMIDVCDAIYLLPNWEDSKGSKIEYDYACANGKKIYKYGDFNEPM